MYYDGTKLLSLKDINGNIPEIYISTSNRTGGKTTYFNRLAVNRFKKNKSKFMLIYRFNYELDDVAEKFFNDIKGLFFPNDTFSSKRKANGIYHELYLNDVKCGYAVTLNSADALKKYSHIFNDVELMIMDEFQSETNHYCDKEVQKLQSIHTSVARGNNKQVRYVPVILIGNPVSLLNPYYVALGISERLQKNTKFLKGNGFVLEQGYNDSASKAQKESAFNKAFSNSDYNSYNEQGVYLNDNMTFIETPTGRSKYVCTVSYKNKYYAIKEYQNSGIVYCDDKADYTYPLKLALTTDDMNINYVMLKSNDFLVANLRYYFEHGCFRFKNLQCKECILKLVSY